MKKVNKLNLKEKGQVSIFFSTVIIVLVTFMAFIINIGIFVKAKINLQNATDAAAYAGASVQARQLTNISYLNWEMRNIYKEWMFKYYVLGSLALPNVAGGNSGGFMDFTMESYTRTSTAAVDKYNFPSVCIDFSSTGGVGMCTKYLVPGLPRFESSNVLGMDETTNAFIDTIVSEKSENCSKRTALNFYTANTWAYNVKTNDPSVSNITAQAPEIASSFMGAFPAAFEMAVRIRNLENEVNTPVVGNVCVNASVGVDCTLLASSLSQPGHERALKAWTSGFRNMGKNGNDGQDNVFKNSFTLKEISPKIDTSIDVQGSLSTILMPNSGDIKKPYLDLKLMTINYATFYTAFTGSQGDVVVDGQTISSEGQCNATKVGLPIPGYPLGFVKNPDILTYYAVEGKAKFTGMFNPFDSQVVLTAYAAAKPFGGRIGPATFNLSDPQKLISRNDRKSSPFITALDTASFTGTFNTGGTGSYKPGMPVPINLGNNQDKFWMTSESDHVGGWIQGPQIYYGIPNMIWDYPSGNFDTNQAYLSPQNVQIIARAGSGFTPQAGLYNQTMFERFKSYLPGIGGIVNAQNIDDAIQMSKAPTLYDAHNYLVPTPETLNKTLKVDSWGAVESAAEKNISNGSTNFEVYNLNLYAPLYSPNALFQTSADVVGAFNQYILRQEAAIRKYQASMNLVAADIFNNNSSGATGQNTGESAAKALSDLQDSQYEALKTDPTLASDVSLKPSCKSISGKFLYFYTGNANYIDEPDIVANCVTPLIDLLRVRWSDASLTGAIYNSKYIISENMNNQLFSAYRPGPQHGANGIQGSQVNPLSGRADLMIRNSYSAKFIPLKGVTNSNDSTYGEGKMNIYSEGTATSPSDGVNRSGFTNPIEESELSMDDINSASH